MTQDKNAGPEVPLLPYERAAPSANKTSFSDLAGRLFDTEAPEGTPEEENEPVSAESEGSDDEDAEDESGAEAPEEDEAEAEESDEEEADEDEESETVEVEVDGVKMTLDEIREARKAGLRQADYTRKTQEVAEQRKAVEAELAQARGVREQYANYLAMLEQVLQQQAPQEPDWDKLRKENPAEYAAQVADKVADKQRRESDLAAIRAEQARLQEEQRSEFEREFSKVIETERQRLVEAIPEWKDEAKAAQGTKALKEYLQEAYAYTEDDLSRVHDHRLMVLSRKAMLYDRLMAKKPQLREKTKSPSPKVLQPGAATTRSTKKSRGDKDALQRAKERLARTGSEHDALAVFRQLID